MSIFQRLVCALSACVIVLSPGLCGCASGASETPPRTTTPPVVQPPGVYESTADNVRAVGVLVRTEGSAAWSVLGVSEGDGAGSYVVAHLGNPEAFGARLAAYEGRYVEVRGTLVEHSGASDKIPVIEAVVIEPLVEDDLADPAP